MIIFMFLYALLFTIKAVGSQKSPSSSNRRSNYNFYIANQINSNNRVDVDSIKYFNITEFNKFNNEYCSADDFTVISKCLKGLANYEDLKNSVKIDTEDKIVYYHTFWHLEFQPHENLNRLDIRIMKLNIFSYLTTQNLLHTKLLVWTVKPIQRKLSMHLKSMLQNYIDKGIIEFKTVNFKKLCLKDLFFELRFNVCSNIELDKVNITSFKDLLRVLLLYNYGGIYVDYDFIYLNDLKPFWLMNFAYRWSDLNDFSMAVFGIRKDFDGLMSKFIKQLLVRSSDASASEFLRSFHPFFVRDLILTLNNGNLYSYLTFKIYHSVLFDPAWLCNDGMVNRDEANLTLCRFNEIFNVSQKRFSIEGFFNGAFTFHYHFDNRKSYSVKNDSYFCHLESYFKSKLKFV